MSDSDDKASWMRAVGATDASWAPSGELLSLRLGPAPVAADPNDDRETQPSMSPQERQRRERLERRAIAERASGGPVRRLDAELG